MFRNGYAKLSNFDAATVYLRSKTVSDLIVELENISKKLGGEFCLLDNPKPYKKMTLAEINSIKIHEGEVCAEVVEGPNELTVQPDLIKDLIKFVKPEISFSNTPNIRVYPICVRYFDSNNQESLLFPSISQNPRYEFEISSHNLDLIKKIASNKYEYVEYKHGG